MSPDTISYRGTQPEKEVSVNCMSLLHKLLLIAGLCLALGVTVACNSRKDLAQKPSKSDGSQGPYSIAIVPERSYRNVGQSIMWSAKFPRAFYVVLTNVSSEPQAAFEYWNSWGYQVISFELTTADGKKSIISKNTQDFDKNFPSTFVILPSEQMIYPIKLDSEWTARPALLKANQMPVSIRAVYEVKPTRESAEEKVWTGRLESKSYEFTLWQQD